MVIKKELYLSLIMMTILLISIVSASTITGKAISGAINGFSSFIDFVKSKISGRSTTQNINRHTNIGQASQNYPTESNSLRTKYHNHGKTESNNLA